MTKRIGIITTTTNIYYETELMHKIFKYFMPIRTEFNISNNSVEILGESDQFDEVIEGNLIPKYGVQKVKMNLK